MFWVTPPLDKSLSSGYVEQLDPVICTFLPQTLILSIKMFRVGVERNKLSMTNRMQITLSSSHFLSAFSNCDCLNSRK